MINTQNAPGVLNVLKFLQAQGRTYAVYGAGKVTRRLLELVRAQGLPPPVCILDDQPAASALDGIPVMRLADAAVPPADEIALGSDTFQDTMRARLQAQFGAAVRPLDLFRPWAPAAASTPAFDSTRLQSRAALAGLRDRHAGRRAFIIGNGPSLQIADLDRLQGEITFASNKIFLAFDQTAWRPTYYTVIDLLVAQNNRDMINRLALTKLFPRDVQAFFAERDDIIWFESCYPLADGRLDEDHPLFSPDLRQGAYPGWTVIYTQLQIAWFMGIREIYLLGVDFSFQLARDTGETCAQGRILEQRNEINHFHPQYRLPGEKWTVPRLDLQQKAFMAARDYCAAHGGRIWNASRQTALEVFPRADLDEILRPPTPQPAAPDQTAAPIPIVRAESRTADSIAPELVTVILPVLNGEPYIGEAIASVVEQNHRAWELLVIDDGSTDATISLIARHQSDPRVRLLRHPGNAHRGVSASRRLGVTQARGNYIAFLDADDCMAPERLARQVDALNRHPAAVLCHTAIRLTPDSIPDPAKAGYFSLGSAEVVYDFTRQDGFLRHNLICNSSVMARTAALRDTAFLPRQLFQFEDWLLWVLLAERGPFVFLPEPLALYRYHPKSATARVAGDPLAAGYSMMEFCLATLKYAREPRTRALAGERMQQIAEQLLDEY